MRINYQLQSKFQILSPSFHFIGKPIFLSVVPVPPQLRNMASSLTTFKKELKTHLFQ